MSGVTSQRVVVEVQADELGQAPDPLQVGQFVELQVEPLQPGAAQERLGQDLQLPAGQRDAGDALGGAPLATPERRPATSESERTWVEVTVRPGDSVWAIVERTFPDEDPRTRVDQVMEARRGAPLVPGEAIQVPR